VVRNAEAVSGWSFCKELIMAFDPVEQRNAHLTGNLQLEFVNGRQGKLAKATVTASSNHRGGSGDDRDEESIAIMWTLWGKQADGRVPGQGRPRENR
jgi:single-strand DNA-binding protein